MCVLKLQTTIEGSLVERLLAPHSLYSSLNTTEFLTDLFHIEYSLFVLPYTHTRNI
jgi:hypothetical protein